MTDLRFALRSLRGRPSYTVVALLTLALGIGANVAIFTVIRGVFLRPLALDQPERLVRIYQAYPERGFLEGAVSKPDFEDWQRSTETLTTMAAYCEFADGMVLAGAGEPEELNTVYITGDFFETLGAHPLLGQTIGRGEQRAAAQRVVISHGFWQRRLGGDPNVVGKTLELNHAPHEIVGVMPVSFRYPSERTEVWASLSLISAESVPFHIRGVRLLDVVARLQPRAGIETAEAELDAVAARLATDHPDFSMGATGATVRPLKGAIVGSVRPALLLLGGAVALVLLIACANVANLTLARATARRRELAVRTALGAGRGRIVRQLLTESLLLATLGGMLGLGLAVWGVELLVQASGGLLPRAAEIRPDAAVLAFAAAVTLLTGVLFGLIPAVRASRLGFGGDLGAGGRGASGSVATGRLRRLLVTAEVALAVVVTIGAGLLLRSFAGLIQVDTGIRHDSLVAASITVPASKYESREAYQEIHRRVLEAVAGIEGVESVASMKTIPLTAGAERAFFTVEGDAELDAADRPVTSIHHATPGLLRTLGVPLLRGRDLSVHDTADSPAVAVASAALVDRYLGDEDPVGQRIVIGSTPIEIVGVAGNVRGRGLGAPPEVALYVAMAQSSRRVFTVLARTAGPPASWQDDIRAAVRSIDPEQPITRLVTMSEVVSESVGQPRFFTFLLGLFGGLALVLSALGIYGLLSYLVGERRREIGIRRALGADHASIVRMVLRQGVTTAAAGVGVGLLAALALSRLLEAQLFGVHARDPLVFLAVAATLLVIGALAGYGPARRALGIAPSIALR